MEGLSAVEVVVAMVGAGMLLAAVGTLFARRTDRSGSRRPALIKRVREIGTFETRNSKGQPVTLVIFQEYLDAGTQGDPNAERKGRRQIMTTDGRYVDKIALRQYRIRGSAEVLTADESNAP